MTQNQEHTIDCQQCRDLVARRATAQACGDYCTVSDCNVLINRHPHHEREPVRGPR